MGSRQRAGAGNNPVFKAENQVDYLDIALAPAIWAAGKARAQRDCDDDYSIAAINTCAQYRKR